MNYLITIFYKIVSFFSHIKKTVIHTNYTKNSELFNHISFPDSFIKDQSLFENFYFGSKDLSYSGCGIIAVYNALFALNKTNNKQDFLTLISIFEKNGTPFNGLIGISPFAIYSFFKNRNYTTDKIISSNKNKINNFSNRYDCFICLIYNDSNKIKSGLHYIFVEKIMDENNSVTFVSHNPDCMSNELDRLIRKINNGNAKPLYTIGISSLN